MADDQHDYKVGPGRPPLHTVSKGNPATGDWGRRAALY
jgi:hypothetical protein